MSLMDAVRRGLSGLEPLQILVAQGGRSSIGQSLAVSLVKPGDQWAAFEAVPSAAAYHPMGPGHGGYAATLLDSTCGCAPHSTLKPDQEYTTFELKIADQRPLSADTGGVRAEGRVVTIGERPTFTKATLTGADGRRYASSTSTLLVFEQ